MTHAPIRLRPVVLVAFALGLALRLAAAWTTAPHPDEPHYIEDSLWASSSLDAAARLHFLREHPRTHYRLEPGAASTSVWPPPFEGRGRFGHIGHPTFHAWLLGSVLAVVPPASFDAAITTGRIVNAMVDASTILLLPALASALGAAPAAGAAAAWLYALHPPSIAYAGIANQDPLLSPLLVLAMLGALQAAGGAGLAAAAAATALMATTKQTGLLVLPLFPLWTLLRRGGRLGVGALLGWGAGTVAIASLVVDPVAYADAILHPTFRMGAMHGSPAQRLLGNLGFVGDLGTYWGLGFDLHGGPPAALVARAHAVATPAWLVVAAAGFLAALAQRRGRDLGVLWLTIFAALAMVPPSDGMWRVQMLWPLACVGAAASLVAASRRWKLAVAAAAVAAMLAAVAPARPRADGTLGLGDLAFANPQVALPVDVHRLGLKMVLPRDARLSRSLVLAPGSYDVSVTADAPVFVELDGDGWMVLSRAPVRIAATGWLHSLVLTTNSGPAVVTAIRLAPVP